MFSAARRFLLSILQNTKWKGYDTQHPRDSRRWNFRENASPFFLHSTLHPIVSKYEDISKLPARAKRDKGRNIPPAGDGKFPAALVTEVKDSLGGVIGW